MCKDKYDRLPHAGDFEKESGNEIVYISPKPLPTGMPAFSSRQLHRDANDVYLDFALTRGAFAFMARGAIGSVMCMLVFFFWASVFGAWLRTHHQPFLSGFNNLFMSWVVWGFLGFLTIMYLGIFCYAVRQVSTHPPIRFNRQRREVVYVPYRGAKPRYVAWESIIACVSVGRLITQYAVIPEFKLMMGLRDANNGSVLWVTVPSGNLDEAVSEWEAIRSYMEGGPSALPTPLPEEFEEGTVAYFHMCRKGYRSDHSFFRYVVGFLMVQFLSGWTLPCYISGWVNNRTKAGFPKEVQKWSQSLPTEQHAMPSEELLRESIEIRKAFANGQNLLDYFKVKFAEPTQEPETST